MIYCNSFDSNYTGWSTSLMLNLNQQIQLHTRSVYTNLKVLLHDDKTEFEGQKVIIYTSNIQPGDDNRPTAEEMNSHLQDNNRENYRQFKSTNLNECI